MGIASRLPVVGTLSAIGLFLLLTVATLMPGSSCAAGTASGQEGTGSIPSDYLVLYQRAGSAFNVPWTILAAIGAIESDHGRSQAVGVHSGVNAFGCCAGPMQFNIRNGPPSTWQSYRVDGDGDGRLDPYAPADAIASAAHYIHALIEIARGDVARAIYGYNHSSEYVDDVLARAKTYNASNVESTSCDQPDEGLGDSGVLTTARTVSSPRTYSMLPAWAMAGGRASEPFDTRLLDSALRLLRTYRLRVTAAREAGHNTHGDGTALDLVPADPVDQAAWNGSAGALARDLGWTPPCGPSGSRPACPLVPAIQFVGYEGYPGHGSPRTCSGSCAAHLHISWRSPCFGTAAPAPPCFSVTAFRLDEEGE